MFHCRELAACNQSISSCLGLTKHHEGGLFICRDNRPQIGQCRAVAGACSHSFAVSGFSQSALSSRTHLCVAMAAEGTCVQQAWVVKHPRLKGKPWLPQIQEVEGRFFVRIRRWCRHFTMYCTGHAMQLQEKRAKHAVNPAALDKVLSDRQQACDAALSRMLQDAASQDPNGPSKPIKARKAREDDQWIVGRIVEVSFGAAEFEGQAMGRRDVAVLWGTKGADLWMELSSENLEHLRLLVMAAPASVEGEPRPRKKRRFSAKKSASKKAKPVPDDTPLARMASQESGDDGSQDAGEKSPAIAAGVSGVSAA